MCPVRGDDLGGLAEWAVLELGTQPVGGVRVVLVAGVHLPVDGVDGVAVHVLGVVGVGLPVEVLVPHLRPVRRGDGGDPAAIVIQRHGVLRRFAGQRRAGRAPDPPAEGVVVGVGGGGASVERRNPPLAGPAELVDQLGGLPAAGDRGGGELPIAEVAVADPLEAAVGAVGFPQPAEPVVAERGRHPVRVRDAEGHTEPGVRVDHGPVTGRVDRGGGIQLVGCRTRACPCGCARRCRFW